MSRNKITVVTIVISALLSLLTCQTTELISGMAQNNSRSQPTRAAKNPGGTESPATPHATRNPNSDYGFVPSSTPRCTVGDNAASIVSGNIIENGSPAVGQRVQASAGEGGEPISEEPAVTDDNGNYQVTFVCGGKACDDAFWVWIIDEDGNQISPFVKFVFDNQCRRGTVSFRNP